jgi:hypothetical protein
MGQCRRCVVTTDCVLCKRTWCPPKGYVGDCPICVRSRHESQVDSLRGDLAKSKHRASELEAHAAALASHVAPADPCPIPTSTIEALAGVAEKHPDWAVGIGLKLVRWLALREVRRG